MRKKGARMTEEESSSEQCIASESRTKSTSPIDGASLASFLKISSSCPYSRRFTAYNTIA